MKEIKKFRISAKHLFLTYPRLSMDLKEVLENLQLRLPIIKNYIISRESHEDGGSHIHVYLELEKLCDIKNESWLDLKGAHGHYEKVKSVKALFNYITKEKEFITNLPRLGDKVVTWKEYVVDLSKSGRLEDAKKFLKENAKAEDLLQNYNRWIGNLKELNIKPHKDPAKYDISKFEVPTEVSEWASGLISETLVVLGQPGIGKTQMLLALGESLGWNPILVRDREDFKKYTDSCKMLILDDYLWRNETGDSIKHLLDSEMGSRMRVLYGSVDIPATVKRAVTTNEWDSLKLGVNHIDFEAINRRIKLLNLGNRSLKKVTVERIVYDLD